MVSYETKAFNSPLFGQLRPALSHSGIHARRPRLNPNSRQQQRASQGRFSTVKRRMFSNDPILSFRNTENMWFYLLSLLIFYPGLLRKKSNIKAEYVPRRRGRKRL